MKTGYIIKSLRLTSNTQPNAEITFSEGLNVISGPTNTGKSYIYECLDYMLGASNIPKDIHEAREYNNIYMEIKMESGEYYSLKRDFKGGNCLCYESRFDDITTTTKYICLLNMVLRLK